MSQSRLTYKIGDIAEAREALDAAASSIRKANANFRRVIDGMLVTEAEYLVWRDNGGAAGSR